MGSGSITATLSGLCLGSLQTSEQHNPDVTVNGRKSATTPLSLPSEIISEIFVLCRPEDPPRPMALPNFAQVCTKWRDTALLTPTLWSTVNLVLHGDDEDEDALVVTGWLTRSGGCPLTIVIKSHHTTRMLSSHPILDALMPHCHRWYDVDLYQLPRSLLRSLTRIQGHLPLLRSLRINMLKVDSGDALNLFASAQNLRTVDLCFALDTVALPWSQITSCKMVENGASCLKVLSECTSLTHGIFQLAHSSARDTPIAAHLPHLTTLVLKPALDLTTFFDALTLPALTALEILPWSMDHTTWPQATFSRFVFRSACAITKLRSRDVFTQKDLIQCLQDLPSLVELDVEESAQHQAIGPAFVALMTCRYLENDSVCLVPQLESLRIRGLLMFGANGEKKLVEMVRSRWKPMKVGVGSLEHVHLRFHRAVKEDALMPLKRLKMEGLDINVVVTGARTLI